MNRHAYMDKLSKMVAQGEINENAYNKLSKKLKKVQEQTSSTHVLVAFKFEVTKIKYNFDEEDEIRSAYISDCTKERLIQMTHKLFDSMWRFLGQTDSKSRKIVAFKAWAVQHAYNNSFEELNQDFNEAFKYLPTISNCDSDQSTVRIIDVNKDNV